MTTVVARLTPGPDGLSPVRPRLVLLGGVPGAGKSTALRELRAADPGVRVLDPDRWRDRFAAALPRLPYRRYRWLVHLLSTVQLLAVLAVRRSGPLVVHAPATRAGRRTLVGRLAALRGWEPVLVFIDVSREAALQGQHHRGRVVRRRSFTRHWARWSRQRAVLREAARSGRPLGPWSRVVLAERATVLATLVALSCSEGPAGHAAPGRTRL